MNYQEWLQWRKNTKYDEDKKFQIDACVERAMPQTAQALKEAGHQELGEKTDAYGKALDTLYYGDESVTEEEWQNWGAHASKNASKRINAVAKVDLLAENVNALINTKLNQLEKIKEQGQPHKDAVKGKSIK